MSNQGYFPTNEAERSVWLAHFRTKLPVHCVELGFSLDDINSTLADIDFYIWLVQSWNPAVQKNAVEASAFKALIGTGSGSELVALPVHVVFDPEPLPVLPGVLTRLFNLIQRIKMAATYNLVVGKDLGIIGTQSTADSDVPDFTVTTERGPTIERVLQINPNIDALPVTANTRRQYRPENQYARRYPIFLLAIADDGFLLLPG